METAFPRNCAERYLLELQRRSLKVLEKRSLKSLLKVRNLYQLSTTLGLEPVSIVHYTRPGSSIKRPTPNYLATQCHVNWPVVYPKSSYKIMDPVSAALPQNLRRIFVATLLHNSSHKNLSSESHSYSQFKVILSHYLPLS